MAPDDLYSGLEDAPSADLYDGLEDADGGPASGPVDFKPGTFDYTAILAEEGRRQAAVKPPAIPRLQVEGGVGTALTQPQLEVGPSRTGPLLTPGDLERLRPLAYAAFVASGRDPARYAKLVEESRATGVPVDVLEKMEPRTGFLPQVDDGQLTDLLTNYPALATYFSDPHNHSFSKNDVENLKELERFQRETRAFQKAHVTYQQIRDLKDQGFTGVTGVYDWFGDLNKVEGVEDIYQFYLDHPNVGKSRVVKGAAQGVKGMVVFGGALQDFGAGVALGRPPLAARDATLWAPRMGTKAPQLPIAQWLQEVADQNTFTEEGPDFQQALADGNIGRMAEIVVGSVEENIWQVPLWFAGPVGFGAIVSSAGGSAYEQGINAGLDPDSAMRYAGAYMAFEGAGEGLGSFGFIAGSLLRTTGKQNYVYWEIGK